MLKKIFGILQRIGKALMLPVALLPAAGLLLGIGVMLQNPDFLKIIPALDVEWIQIVATIMERSGNIIFSNLPLIFAVGVAVGLCNGDGVAGLAAIVGFLILNVTMGIAKGIEANMILNNPIYTEVLGIPTIQTGVFGGIIIGLVSAALYHKFYNIHLPEFLGFFSGKRFVPIISAIFGLIIGLIMSAIWPTIQYALLNFSRSLIYTNQTMASFIFGVVERGLIPFGLHHIWYNPFWYQFGEYINASGQLIMGDQAIFFEQLKDGVALTAGTFMTGKFPFMMFGLPAAALAMYHESYSENRKGVAGLLFSAALTSFLTGITEPIEFMFLFVAPVLFAVHCIFAGLSFMIMQILNVKIGLTFSGGLIDYLMFGVLPNRTPWYLVILVGIVFSIIYYLGFRFIIRKLDLKTPGREEEDIGTEINIEGGDLAKKILSALGGKNNITYLDSCITRLRVTVIDLNVVRKNTLKSLGAAGIMVVGNNLQIIFGPKSDIIKEQIKDLMEGKKIKETPKKKIKQINKGIDTGIEISIPITGKVIQLEKVPDDIFSMKLIGDGFAIDPIDNILYSPVEGRVVAILPTKHSITIKTTDGLEVFMHIGIDTIKLNGEGFNVFVKENDLVSIGDKLIEFPIEEMKEKIKSKLIPIIFKNLHRGNFIYFQPEALVQATEKNRIQIHKKE
ncbi:glucose-specific PTS transporter subunit IIBC [Clostridium chauvoei]|uniref:Glucose-specific PTS transporter subunit IIBC n=1 Tax=Clostridium chauvoei TaxID=46867 RepID=A0ABD4RIA7_9CLOT|nr:glucose-specific PTS transporter subunit IIBC [Clostridium chauvoei]ATD56258.1 PTS glucose transporter subunit IICBA [Clostridium chauvoei]ATD58646.1 PTS glucose transporter subunit IICBA [Clostridium chauvoei]MBX7281141.1 glucose-specific PTS transporter subunit IIBC [Clostridium chauvoei]MBX7283623.1 glucose-specific PTS transporter subunit IIBC [Clostridium chauvoei]MBX7286231.1 glucose-specific PTS transporter subunit IIBC [Clostridium chauvoei]